MHRSALSMSLRIVLGICVVLLLSSCRPYVSIGKSVGGFLHPVSGPDFVHIDDSEWDSEQNALIYFYRPHSEWAGDEIESPSVYIDDHHYFNIRDNSFTWLEVAPGVRKIDLRRPLLGLEGLNDFALSHITDASLATEAGQVYYLRYSEVEPPASKHPNLDPEDPLASGEMQLVTRDVAMGGDNELPSTQFLNSDLLAPNHAATSVVQTNQDDDYERRLAELEVAREEEIATLKASGDYNEAPWYWPFGGEPSKPLETDRRIQALNDSRAEIEAERERKAAQEDDGWWPF